MTRLILLALAFAVPLAAQPAVVSPPAALTLDHVPPVPAALRTATQPYLEFRSAAVAGWNPRTHGLLIATRFGNSTQLHEVARAGGDRTQISFEEEPVTGGAYAPRRGDVLLVSKDVGGGEFYQLYTLSAGRLTLLTDGTSRNEGATWDREGNRVAYSSTRRNGTDSDLYVVDPRDPRSDHRVATMTGNGWRVAAFAPGGTRALVEHDISVERSEIYELDTATGAMTRLTPPGNVAWSGPAYGPDGTIYATSDVGGDVARLGRLGHDGRFSPLNPEMQSDVKDFAVADDGRFITYVVNEAGVSRLRLLDPTTGRVRGATLPAGVIGGLSIAPWGQVAFTLASATSPGDAFVLDPATMVVTQWTASETGGLDPTRNRPPALITVKSFDGVSVSGFLYRPDPTKFAGKRPLIISIHGGPEGQSRPGFQERRNYLLNELGIAIFYPNVRGSTGYGKAFVALDNGPFKREDSVRDIGAFLDTLVRDPGLDATRVAVAGGSYGGYMCYASAIRFAGRFRAAQCTVAISNFRHLPRKHPELSSRPASRRVRRRARPSPAREAGRDFTAHPDRRDQGPAVHRHRRQRSAGAAERGGAGRGGGAPERRRGLAHGRRRRGPRL